MRSTFLRAGAWIAVAGLLLPLGADRPPAALRLDAGPAIASERMGEPRGPVVQATQENASLAVIARRAVLAPTGDTDDWEPSLVLLREGEGAGADALAVAWMRATPGARTRTEILLARSDDGARNFTEVPLATPTREEGIEFDPVLASDGRGRGFLLGMGQPAAFGSARSAWATSFGGGTSASARAFAEGSVDKGDVEFVERGGVQALVVADRTGIRRSLDAGASFGPPWRPANWSQGLPALAAAPDGTLGVAYVGSEGVYFVRSTDAGASWSEPVRVHGAVDDQDLAAFVPGSFRVAPLLALAYDPHGRASLVVTDLVDGTSGFVLLRSDEGARFVAEDAPARSGAVFAPSLAFDPSGRLHLAYFSTQDGATVSVHLSSRPPGGAWTSTRIDGRGIPASASAWAPFGGSGVPFFGDYLGLAASAHAVYVAYPAAAADGRLRLEVATLGAALAPADFAGSWYEPATSGQGFDVQWIAPGRLLVYFYGHTDAGENLFLIGVHEAPFAAGQTLEIAMTQTRGGRFNGLDPAAIVRTPWGTLRLRFDDCQHAHAQLDGRDGRSALALVPLARPISSRCP